MSKSEMDDLTRRCFDFVEAQSEGEWGDDLCEADARKMAEFVKAQIADKLAPILVLIGNVDHSKGNGPNSAKMRGDMLNDIRRLLQAA